MGLLAEKIYNIINTIKFGKDKKSNFIFYKIVDFDSHSLLYTLQCINTKTTFLIQLVEIIFDVDILFSLHPVQACFVGIEYAKYEKRHNINTFRHLKKLEQYSICRYGSYRISYQNRNGEICFVHIGSNKNLILDPRDIALSEDLIIEFDAAQAFYIGISAGLKMNILKKQVKKPPFLRLVK